MKPAPAALPFDGAGLQPRRVGDFELWPLGLGEGRSIDVAVLSMGNPHAVHRVDDVAHFPVAQIGPLVSAVQRDRVSRYLQEGADAGAKAAAGGHAGAVFALKVLGGEAG